MTDDDRILDDILRREGGYVDHPADRGGCTNRGVTRVTLAAWRGVDVTCEDVKQLSEQEARDIYRAKYLAPFVDVDPALKPHVVDIAVNSGLVRARELLQRAQQQTERSVAVQLVIERLKFYARIVQKNPSQVVFFAGWINRAMAFIEPALESSVTHSANDVGEDVEGGGAA